MTAKRDLKRRVRERQARTGESYTTARRHVLAAREENAGDDPEATDPAGDTPPSDTEQAGKGEPASGGDRRQRGDLAASADDHGEPANATAAQDPTKPAGDTPPSGDERAAKGESASGDDRREPGGLAASADDHGEPGNATAAPDPTKPAGDTPPSGNEQAAKAAKGELPKPIADPETTSDTPPSGNEQAAKAAKGELAKPIADPETTSAAPSDAEQAAKGEPTKPIADPDVTIATPASTFESDEVTAPGATRLDTRDERAVATRLDTRDERAVATRLDDGEERAAATRRDARDERAAGTASRWPDEMNLPPSDHANPIDVDEALDFTNAAAELGMKCMVLMFPKLAERADPARVLAAVRDALAATQNDPATELLRKLVFRGEAPRGLVVLTREPRFRQHVEAGFTGVSSDGRVLAIHVAGHQGIVTALGTVWRNTSTLVLMAPDDFVTRLVMPPGTIQELGARYGVSIPAGPIAPMPHTSPGSLRGITTSPGATREVPTVFLIFNGRRYPITRELFVIGRSHASNLQIKDGHISRKHAAVSWQNGAHYLVDLASHAGIEFRGLKIKNKRIEEGDVFSLGEYVLRFTYLATDG